MLLKTSVFQKLGSADTFPLGTWLCWIIQNFAALKDQISFILLMQKFKIIKWRNCYKALINPSSITSTTLFYSLRFRDFREPAPDIDLPSLSVHGTRATRFEYSTNTVRRDRYSYSPKAPAPREGSELPPWDTIRSRAASAEKKATRWWPLRNHAWLTGMVWA